MNSDRGGIILETIQLGNSVKITAIDVATGIEASIIADIHSTAQQRERLARQKLRYVMTKKGVSPL